MKGTIVRIFHDKNFAFIKGEGEEDERFMHRGAVDRGQGVPFDDFEVGDIIEFDPFDAVKGPRAENVRLLGKAGDIQQGELSEP